VREPWLLALVGATAVLGAVASLIRHAHFQSRLDLAIFDQVGVFYDFHEIAFAPLLIALAILLASRTCGDGRGSGS